MNILIIIVHPQIEQSRVNKRWKEVLIEQAPSSSITIHELYKQYPDEKIDVKKEQALLLAHDRIVFQFPLYWYSTPPLLKKWQDEVLQYGWVYPAGLYLSESRLFKKELILAISIGGSEELYQVGGRNHFTISELTRPLQQMANVTGMTMLKTFRLHNAYSVSDEQLAENAASYVKHLCNPELNQLNRL